MGFVATIAKRFLISKKHNTFLSFIAGVSLFGVALGVAALVVVMAVMEGFEAELRSVITATHSHVLLYSQRQIISNADKFVDSLEKQYPEIEAISPFVYNEVMLSHEGSVVGSIIEGIEKSKALQATQLNKQIVSGTLPEQGNIMLASVVAQQLQANIGDKIAVISPYFDKENMVPKTQTFTVSGIITTGMYEYDSKYSLITVDDARLFFQLPAGSATALKIKLKNIDDSEKLVDKLRSELSYPYIVRNWTDLNKNLLYAIKLQKVVIFIVLTSIIVVAAFNIVSTLMMMMDEKQRDMSILKAIGMNRKQSAGIFITVGFVIGLCGMIAGTAFGLLLCNILATTKFIHLPPDIYYISYLPVEVRPLTLLLVAFSALFVALLATVYPAYEVAVRPPVEGLRYE